MSAQNKTISEDAKDTIVSNPNIRNRVAMEGIIPREIHTKVYRPILREKQVDYRHKKAQRLSRGQIPRNYSKTGKAEEIGASLSREYKRAAENFNNLTNTLNPKNGQRN